MRLSRRSALIGGLTFAAAVCAAARVHADPGSPLDQRIGALEQKYDAVVGLSAVSLDGPGMVARRADESFAMCSTFKAYAAGRILQGVRSGEFPLDATEFVDPAAVVANSPRTGPRAGTEMTLAELCQAALQVSDNTAANLLLRRLGGPQAVTAFARSIGDERTRLDRWETELNSAIPGDPRDTSTPAALAAGYRALLTGDTLTPAHRSLLEQWMLANETSSMRAGLPPGWSTADKTGAGDYGSTNDVGIAYGPDGRRVLLAIMTRSATDNPKADTLRPLIGELAGLVVPYLADLSHP
ncbi:class A beta-lactamase [Mycolicibacterium sp. J2]|uniref:class A beta-lactamase n=1 Tax=Mycolicibacterium sp. J2 TaxID=2993511 RepID=UPI00224B18E2|nr:class A beta-lactamase [Mycolicibacterium sp. J2]MCX2711421.1 class A beta-lactamase [Mycolicibacterium sp. J2]